MSDNLTNQLSDNDNSRLDQIISMLGSLDSRVQKLEERQYDTKPIWEHALAEIAETRAEMRERFAELNTELSEVRTEMREGFKELNREVKQTNRLIRTLSNNSLKMQSDIHDLDDRVGDLETKAT